jgi:Na+/H+-dicarboxylate symporter
LKNNAPKGVDWNQIITIQLLDESMQVLMMFVSWIIWCAPFCILSLVATAVGSQSDMVHVVETLGWLFVSFLVGALGQVTFVYCGLYFYYFRSNPLTYFKSLVEAMTLAFASASSAATLPVSLECVSKSGKVHKDIARFVLPLGATINMDGVAIYIVCTAVALAYLNGITPTAANYVILAFCATLGSIGTAPVPASGPVMALTAFNTAFQQ